MSDYLSDYLVPHPSRPGRSVELRQLLRLLFPSGVLPPRASQRLATELRCEARLVVAAAADLGMVYPSGGAVATRRPRIGASCSHGHPLTPENRILLTGYPRCRICTNERQRQYRQRPRQRQG